MKLTELFDTGVKARWTQKEPAYSEARFNIEGTHYMFSGEPWATDRGGDVPAWRFEFSVVDEDGEYHYGNTGTGNQFAVYSTVISLIKEFVRERGVLPISMGADDIGRQSLYQRMIRKALPDWRVERVGKDINAYPPGHPNH